MAPRKKPAPKAAATKAAASKATASKAATSKAATSKAATSKAAASKAAASKAAASKAATSKAAPSKAAPSKAAPSKAPASKPAAPKSAKSAAAKPPPPAKSTAKSAAASRSGATKAATQPAKPSSARAARTANTKAPAPTSSPKAPSPRATTRNQNTVTSPKAPSPAAPAETPAPTKPASTAKKATSAAPSAANRASKKRPAPSQSAQPKKAARVGADASSRRALPSPVYDEIWKEVYLAGTEWDQLKDVYAIDWDFEHLDDTLTDGDMAGKKVHLFGCTEPQLIRLDEKDQKGHVVPVPVIVAFVCDVPPPPTVGIKSVQRATEEIVPMAKLRMAWQAYSPPNVALKAAFKPLVHVLTCTQRKARLRNMGEEDVHTYDYVLPYFVDPEKGDETDENTVVQVLADLEGVSAPLMCEFDYEMDELAEFVETTLEEQELDQAKHGEALKKAIRENVRATKLKYKKEREERQKRIDAIPQEEKDALKAKKVVKFYPANEWPDVSGVKSRFVNRYYGHANEVV